MFLTRFDINRGRRGARKLLGSPHAMHAAVEAAFPTGGDLDGEPLAELPAPAPPASTPPASDSLAAAAAGRDAARVLWRLDEDDRRAMLYILSPSRPDCTHLVEQAGWPTRPDWDTRSYTPLLERLAKGQLWAFRLTANPTKSVRLHGGKRSQRVGHVTAAQQRDWLLERAPGWGFTVPEADGGGPAVLVTGRRVRTFRRSSTPVEISTAVFDGRLIVEDLDTFRQALLRGLGPAKGYGCGLLTLARPTPTPAS